MAIRSLFHLSLPSSSLSMALGGLMAFTTVTGLWAQNTSTAPDAAEVVESAVEQDITGTPGLAEEANPEPAPAESPAAAAAESAAVQAAEDAIVASPPDAATTENPVEAADGEAVAADEEITEEELDVIPLPEEMNQDPAALELPGDVLFPAQDLPPLEAAPALPNIPVGEAARRLRARYQKVRLQVEKDPAVVALKEAADAARTFEDQRAALREYYRLLFQKMREADATLTERINTMEQAYLNRLSQTRIEPTIPLNPPPTPPPLTPNPTATPGRN